MINGNKAVKHRAQLSPVSVPIADLFKDKIFPQGEIQMHPGELSATARRRSEQQERGVQLARMTAELKTHSIFFA